RELDAERVGIHDVAGQRRIGRGGDADGAVGVHAVILYRGIAGGYAGGVAVDDVRHHPAAVGRDADGRGLRLPPDRVARHDARAVAGDADRAIVVNQVAGEMREVDVAHHRGGDGAGEVQAVAVRVRLVPVDLTCARSVDEEAVLRVVVCDIALDARHRVA